MIRIVDGIPLKPEITYTVESEGVFHTSVYADGYVRKSLIVKHDELTTTPDEFIGQLLTQIPGSKRG